MTNALTVTAPEGLPYIDTAREFDAPVDAVFRAHRDPDLLKQWMGPDGYEMDIERHDFVSQGGYRFVHRNPEGQEFGFNGVFHTVRDNDFAIQTFEYDGAPDQVSIEFLTFTDLGDGRTRLAAHAVYPSVETRDAMVASGMEKGMVEGYDKLERLLTSVDAGR
jgi:uncharacterized protein YndB with AHSA1/START domain